MNEERTLFYSNNLLLTCLQLHSIICFLLPFAFLCFQSFWDPFLPTETCSWLLTASEGPLLTFQLQLLTPTGSLFMFLSSNRLEKKMWLIQLILSWEIRGLILRWTTSLWISHLLGSCPANPVLPPQSPATCGSWALEMWLVPRAEIVFLCIG